MPLEFRCSTVDVAVENRSVVIVGAASVTDDGRRVTPAQAVIFESEVSECGGGDGQRIEGAVEIADVSRGELGALDGAAGPVLRFEDDDVPSRVSEHGRGDEPVVS